MEFVGDPVLCLGRKAKASKDDSRYYLYCYYEHNYGLVSSPISKKVVRYRLG